MYNKGVPYRYFLKHLHDIIAPERYFEIGVDQGSTLALARCHAIAVDPSFARLKQKRGLLHAAAIKYFFNQPVRQLFEMTSDDFFATQDLSGLFSKENRYGLSRRYASVRILAARFYEHRATCSPSFGDRPA